MVSQISVFLVSTAFKCGFVCNLSFLNSVSSHDKFEIRLLVIDGNCLIIEGGWLDFECIYRGVFFDFLKVLKQHSSSAYLHNLQERICVMILTHICTA